ncbi:MAG: NUDIX hydrolase [Flavobacteriales bacterium]|nr:NUDIX hydrolase [Flavobacteriales bacterium]
MDISVDCVIFGFNENSNSLQVLLIEQEKLENIPPLSALPGDFVLEDEDLDDSAKRVLMELTNLSGVFLKQFHVFGDPNRIKEEKDQKWLLKNRKNPHNRVITIGYYSLVRMEDYRAQPASFAQKTEWIDINEIPTLAFDHNRIVKKALKTLRRDTLHNNISFELLPKKFTLAQLQNLYEIILNKELDRRNFRKSIKRLEELISLNEKQKNVFHKPAQLYSFKQNLDEIDI